MTRLANVLSSARKMIGVLFILGSMAGVVHAAENLGPPVGTKAPDIGRLLDEEGAPRGFADIVGDKGLVLLFVRSASWCPICQKQLIEINKAVSEIEARGYKLVALSYDKPEVLASFKAKRNIKYGFLSDPKSEIIDRYNLRDPQYGPNSFAYGVPRPIILFIDPDGTIKGKLFEETYKTRPPVEAIVEKIDAIAGGR